MIDPIPVGKVLKSHGVQGDLFVTFHSPFEKSITSCRALFLDLDGNPVPFLIENYDDLGDHFRVKLKHIDSRDQSVKMHGKPVLINRHELKSTGAVAPTADLSGFVIDHDFGEALTIKRLEEYPQQLMLVCHNEELSDVMIPLVEDWIESIDEDKQRIRMKLPEGLLPSP